MGKIFKGIKNKFNKIKAFTLVELLAVIVILSIIAVISIPLMSDVIDNAKKGAFKNSVYGIVRAAELSYSSELLTGKVEKLTFSYVDGNEVSNVVGHKLDYKGKKPENGIIIVNENGQVGLALETEKWCAQKDFSKDEIVVSEAGTTDCTFEEDTVGPIITFEPDGSDTYIKSSSVRISVFDQRLDYDSLMYVWTDIEEIPNYYVHNFENMSKIAMPKESGVFYLHVTATDFYENVTQEYRKFLLDNEAPVITINGETNITINKGNIYIDAGATVTDNIDVNVSITTTGTVNPNVLGTYTITYTAEDTAGNKTTVTRTINVIDVDAPVITLLGDDPVNIYVDQPYVDTGATAYDKSDGDVTSDIIVTGTVNPSVPGTYTITYTVSDEAGNVATRTRTVNVIDNIKPIVTFGTNGNSIWAKNYSTKVTVSDAHSGVNTNSLKYFWSISTAIPGEEAFTTPFTNGTTLNTPSNSSGTYYLWILAKDNAGNTTITGSNGFNIDNTNPVLTLNGSSVVNINAGTSYNDAGANANDEHSGINGSVTISGTVNANVPGSYVITYTVSDKAGNTTSIIRTVNVIDNTNPAVVFEPNGNATYQKSNNVKITVSDAHSGVNTNSLKYLWNTSTDIPSEENFSKSFVNGATINTPTSVTGDYYLWILAKDNAGNTTIVRSNVFKLDNTKPVITLNGDSAVTITVGTTYTDAGATATDAHSGISGNVTTTGTVNVNVPGTYTITYNVSDKSGNAADPVTRIVMVKDVEAPVITILGDNPINIYVEAVYSDPGATAIDYADGNVTSKITSTGTVNTSIPGTYYITYKVKDNANNEATATRTINVIDNVAPTVTFSTDGNSIWAKSHSTKVTVTDAHSSVNSSSLGYYWTTSTTQPPYSYFEDNPFSNGTTFSTPSNKSGGYYLWIYAKDSVGNVTVTRSNVFNLDNTAPVITIVGDNPASVLQGNSYTDAGATATDAHSGLNGSVTTSGTVNTSQAGTYTLTYTATDKAGNTATATRTVNVISSSTTFSYTGTIQTFVPAVTGYYKLEVWGASGASVYYGKGGYAVGAYSMTAGTTYYVVVGGTSTGIDGGYNGGGYGGNGSQNSNMGGGGGATHIATATGLLSSLSNNKTAIIIVAGAGAGQGYNGDYYSSRGGGVGGGLTGGRNYGGTGGGYYAYGGSQTAGGTGLDYNGSFGQGANTTPNTGNSSGYMIYRGGGGGGGYYGGGSGQSAVYEYLKKVGGGGGGSSYIGGVTTYGGVTAQTISGDASMPSPTGGTQTGHSGNGYAKITYLGG